LVNAEELNQIRKFYSLSCPECGSEAILISVRDKVEINCEACNKTWSGSKELTEETGPRLAEVLSIRRNRGIWKARWDMLSSRTGNVFSSLSDVKKAKSTSKKKQTIKNVQAEKKPLCPQCGSPMKLIKPKPGQRWKKFWGCTKYWSTGCKGSRKA
jgi:ssDNA-binding Zn-finger/Zn-ribbon topoisomerase 1